MPGWLVATLGLLAPALCGVLAGASGLVADPERAVASLNRFALYFAFPALIFTGIAGSEIGLPTEPGFWLLVPSVLLVTLVGARVWVPEQAGTLALISAFGNVAYLGLPVVEQVLGSDAMGTASLAAGIHVSLALTVGPYLLLRWAPERPASEARSLWGPLLRQPLLWAPWAGFAAHLVPFGLRSGLVAVVAPLGRAAAPVALFMLGLYLVANRRRVSGLGVADGIHVLVKLLAMPVLTFALACAAVRGGWLASNQAQVLTLLSTMPAAITTFAMAQEHGVGAEATARAIVLTTLVSGATIPLAAWLVLDWVPNW